MVPRREVEETEASGSWGTRLHHHGPPGIMSGQEQGPPHKLDLKEKIHRTSPGTKRAHTMELSNPETYVNPKALKETHAPALLEAPSPQARRRQTNPTPKRRSGKEGSLPRGPWQKRNKEVLKGYTNTGYRRNGEEMRRLKQQMKKDQNEQAHKQGQREGRNHVYSQSGTMV